VSAYIAKKLYTAETESSLFFALAVLYCPFVEISLALTVTPPKLGVIYLKALAVTAVNKIILGIVKINGTRNIAFNVEGNSCFI
jgi:uncharacterized membrane protein